MSVTALVICVDVIELGNLKGRDMNHLRKFVERGASGNRRCRTAYAFNASVLPETKAGLDWRPVVDFSAADEILVHPDLKNVFEAALKNGFTVV